MFASFSVHLIVCLRAATDEAVSEDKYFGLKKGVSAPYFFEIVCIFLLSVETMYLSIYLLF